MLVTMKTGYGLREKGRNRLAVPGQTVQLPYEEAMELINRGLAVPASGGPLADEERDTPCNYHPEEGQPAEAVETDHLDTADLNSINFADLKKLAEDMGLDVSACRKKVDVIALITAVDVSAPDDGEALPTVGAEGPVV